MIYPKITRAVFDGEFPQQEESIVTGISDYIPQSVKSQSLINISVVGTPHQVINQILWNEFFSKSLIKEAYYLLMHHYSTQGRQTPTAVFAKFHGKVHKLGQVMDWRSELREALLRENSEVLSIEIEAFSNRGNIRKINIFVSRHPIGIEKCHLILRTDSIEPAKISKNNFSNQMGFEEFRYLQETDRSNKINSNPRLIAHKTKTSLMSNVSLKTKQSSHSKQNKKKPSKPPSSKFSSKKTEKRTSKQKTFESNNKDCSSRFDIEPRQRLSVLPERPSINRESVLAKIITSKEEQIIILKEELEEKSEEYEILIREQDEAHKKQVANLTKSVKEVLESYSASQKQALNENVYLKERVGILEENLTKTNEKMEDYTQKIETHIIRVRELEETNRRLQEANKKLMEEQDRIRSTQISQCTRMAGEVSLWKQKAEEYRNKYEKVVEVMKSAINFS